MRYEHEALDLRTARRRLNITEELMAKGWYHSLVLPDGRVMQGTQSLEYLEERLAGYPIPMDLRGKRVLDLGARDGWFSFAMEKRGAEVVAVDCVEMENFRFAHRMLGSRVDYRVMDMFEVTPDRVGRFDIVLCLGLIYHLKHPLLALERVCDLTADLAIVESFVSDENLTHNEYPWMEFYESDELGGQGDNWIGPNVECLLAFCRTAGFARVRLVEHSTDHRASVACHRKWEPAVGAGTARPTLQRVLHSQNHGINFNAARDEYISAWFLSGQPALCCDIVFAQVGDYGARPMYLTQVGERAWQMNFKLPPGLCPGWQPVRVSTSESGWSNALEIALDVSTTCGALHVKGACDGAKYSFGRAELQSGWITLWVSGLPVNADLNNVRVYLGTARLTPDYLQAEPDSSGYRQVNARLPRTIEPGSADLVVRFGDVESNAFPFVLAG